jgi:hypothetical protein
MIPPSDLTGTTRALERGNWPVLTLAVLRHLAGPTEQRARLGAIQLLVAASQRSQARGEVVEADEHLDTAARALPPTFRRIERGRCYAVLPGPPPADDPESVLIWRTARMILRDQRGLDEHRARLRPGRLSPHEVLVVAYVEFLRWVACDYVVTTHHAELPGVCCEPRSAALRRRANDLCRLASPTAPDLGEGVWRGSGGPVRLEVEALADLAAGALVPPDGPGALPPSVPVRCGRAEAYRRARQRGEDLDEGAL